MAPILGRTRKGANTQGFLFVLSGSGVGNKFRAVFNPVAWTVAYRFFLYKKSPCSNTARAFSGFNKLLLNRLNCPDAAVSFMYQFSHLDIAEVRLPRKLGIMIKEVPLAFKLHDRVVVGPALYRIQDHALIGKWTIRIVTCGVSDVVGISC